MSKILLVGPAGCGKTHKLLDSFGKALSSTVDPLAADFFFVVPSAEHTERVVSLLIQRGLKGFFYQRVTTLSRLVGDIFRVTDIPVASSLTRTLIIRDLIRENTWDYFEGVCEQPGFLGLMAQFMTELKESCVSPEVFRDRMNALKGFEPAYAAKYEALADFYEQYEVRLKEQGLRDSQDALRIFRERKKKADLSGMRFKGIWVDGFFDFSNLQLEYLRELSAITENITIALTKEEGQGSEDAFEAVNQTERDLEKLGFETQTMKSRSHRTERPSLLFLQKNIFSQKASGPAPEPGQDIVILDAIGTEGEIELIARQIHKLYATGDYRYSDFAVLFRQIRHYAPIIASVFSRYGIPAEIHERERLKFSSWIATVASLLSVFRNDWQREDIFAFLKSGYTRRFGKEIVKDKEWLAEFEQRSFREGVTLTREAWVADWSQGESGSLPWFNQKKTQTLKTLMELEDWFRAAKTTEDHIRIFKRAVYDTFGILEISDRYTPFTRRNAACVKRFEALLDEIQGHFLKNRPNSPSKNSKVNWASPGNPQSGKNSPNAVQFPHGGNWGNPDSHNGRENKSQDRCQDRALGISFESFADHFLGLVELDVYSLHERDKNRVQVYDVSLARQKEYRVVFVAGLLEKVFPMQIREDPLLSDWERKLMNGGMEHPLAECLPRQNIERFFFYVAVTRAKEKLFLSYPHLDFEGKESLPSFYLEEVKELFGGRTPVIGQDLSRPLPTVGEAITHRELEASVADALRNTEGREAGLQEALARLSGDPQSRERLLSALRPVEAKILDKKILEGKYFEIPETSPTRLETYAKCPFRYFSDKILKLQDTGEDIRVMQKGNVLHHVLQRYFDPCGKKDPKETLEEFVQREIEEGLKRHPMLWAEPYEEALDRRELFEMLVDFINYEGERLKSASFKPYRVEYSFGNPNTDPIAAERRLGPSELPFGKEMKNLDGFGENDHPALEIEGERKKIKLRGRVDRIDTDDGKKFAVVIDYKRSAKFKAANLELGTALQLPLYLLAAQKHLGLTPLGAEIYSVRDHKRSGFYGEGSAQLFEKEFAPRSQLPDEVFQKTLDRAVAFVRKFTKEIELAEIPVRPRDCESFCPYDTVCRIEKWKLPIILEKIRQEDEKAGLKEKQGLGE
ncbi:MAG: PD-(D/E)XK nuclease family protein [Candidatus Omnitrophota bacterium]